MEKYKLEDREKRDFYRTYKELFSNEKYKKTSSNSKWAYIIILDNLNIANTDNEGNLYLVTIREEMKNILGLSINTITKIFKELSDVELISEIKQKAGEPTIVYPLMLEIFNIHKNDEPVPIICDSVLQKETEPLAPKSIIENFTDDDVAKAEEEIRKLALEKISLNMRMKYDVNISNFCENDIKMLKIAIQIVIGSSKFDSIDRNTMNKAILECKTRERDNETPVIKLLVECIINECNSKNENTTKSCN